jgi:hypothetical protein
VENVGLMHVDAGELLVKYIDFEIKREKISSANLLCFMAAGTPFTDGGAIQAKYIQLLESKFESIFESLLSEDSEKEISDKNKPQYTNLVKILTDDCKGDKA